jgi:hypothetical protein
MKKIGKILVAVGALMILFGTSAGVTGAFLTKPVGERINIITVGSVNVTVTEPNWQEENGRNLVPGERVKKDPTVTNTGKNGAWVFLRLEIPIRSVSLVRTDTKRKEAAENHELFCFQPGNEWQLISHTREGDNACYVYGYRYVLEPGASSEPLFQELSLVNVLEGELDETEQFEIPIEAVAIQDTAGSSDKDLQNIYETYLMQEATDAKGAME